MKYEEFIETIKEEARAYAESCILDAVDHEDAVEAVTLDFIAGAKRAYEVLHSCE